MFPSFYGRSGQKMINCGSPFSSHVVMIVDITPRTKEGDFYMLVFLKNELISQIKVVVVRMQNETTTRERATQKNRSTKNLPFLVFLSKYSTSRRTRCTMITAMVILLVTSFIADP